VKIEGTVSPDEIPESGLKGIGVWTGLAVEAIEAHHQGKVLVVAFQDHVEFKRARNGMAEKLRLAGYGRQFTTIDNPDGSVKAYLRVHELQPAPSVVVQPLARPRRRASG
jgi:hypothetical protein